MLSTHVATLARFGLALFGLTSCTPSTDTMTKPTPVTVEAEPAPPASADGPEYFFAVLGQSGIEHCPGGQQTWLDVHPTLGFIPTSGVDEATLEPLMDLPVLARGSAGAAPPRPPIDVELEMCPAMQMRSDWVSTPRGIRVRRTQPPAIEHFFATSVRRLDELTVTRDGDAIVVSLRNPLPFTLDAVSLELHYEGCYGKPGSTSRRTEATSLAPGATLSERFWLIAEHGQADPPPRLRGGPRIHRAAALVVWIEPQQGPEGAPVHGDLSVSLSALGVDFECE